MVSVVEVQYESNERIESTEMEAELCVVSFLDKCPSNLLLEGDGSKEVMRGRKPNHKVKFG